MKSRMLNAHCVDGMNICNNAKYQKHSTEMCILYVVNTFRIINIFLLEFGPKHLHYALLFPFSIVTDGKGISTFTVRINISEVIVTITYVKLNTVIQFRNQNADIF